MFDIDGQASVCDPHPTHRRPESTRQASVPDFAWRSAAKVRVLVAHPVRRLSTGLCSSLNELPECDARLWDDELGGEYSTLAATGAEVLISDPARGMQLLEGMLQQDRANADLPSVVVVLLRDLPALEKLASTRVMRTARSDRSPADPRGAAACTTQALKGGLPPRALRRVCEHVRDRLDGRITHRELAAIAGLSESHFSRAFKRSVGMSAHRYISRRRVESAAELIAETDQPLSEIALAVGFSDQSHFTRVFHRLTGETPGAFRRRHR